MRAALRTRTSGSRRSTETTVQIVVDQSEIHFYTWGDSECCLPRGATRATLRDSGPDAEGTRGARSSTPATS